MSDLHPQDWLLIAEALADHIGADIDCPRDQRAWDLVDAIGRREGLSIGEIPLQTRPATSPAWLD